jgi:hypothetical protein
MNRNRLSTVTAQPGANNIQERVLNLLAAPSNYEIQPDGKILRKSSGVYLKGRGNIGIEVYDEKDSIIECALFFSVSTINRRLDKNVYFTFNGQNLKVKRVITHP